MVAPGNGEGGARLGKDSSKMVGVAGAGEPVITDIVFVVNIGNWASVTAAVTGRKKKGKMRRKGLDLVG